MKRVKGVKYMVMEGDKSLGGEHTMRCADGVLCNCILKTYVILLINAAQ